MKAKIINFSTQYKIESNSGSYWDYIWLQKMWIELTKWDDYDFIIFSLSNIVMAWWVLWTASLEWLKILKQANQLNKPVICLFLDFKTYTNKLSINNTMRKKYEEIIKLYELEDYRDNWYLAHYCRDEEKFKKWIENQKNWIKFKDENIFYFNNMTVWFYDIMKVNDIYWNICYIWNWRWWERNKFLNKFIWFDIYWRWKDKQINELNHNFKWVIKQTKVKEILNKYYWHIITYDNIWIDYQVDITRLVYTVSAWCLPIIDKRLKYLNLPEEFDLLFIDHQDDLDNLLFLTIEERNNIIIRLQEYFSNKLNPQKELDKIYNIINDYYGKSL